MRQQDDKGAVLITGASTGIGRACALWLDRAGHRVFAGVRKPADAESLRAEASPRLCPVLLDVVQQESIDRALGEVRAALGDAPLAGLVNNAGIGTGGPIEYLPLDELRRQLEVNVVGQVAVTQAALPLLRRGAAGRVVNIGSIGGRVASALMGPYCMSKFALEALSDTLRRELQPWGIQVALVEPGAVKTPIWGKANATADEMKARMTPEAIERYQPQIERLTRNFDRQARAGVEADEVARVVEHALTSRRPRTRYLVGGDARVAALLTRLLPDRALDWILRRAP